MDDQFVRVPRKRRSRFGSVILNLLTMVVLAAIIGVVGVYALIFVNPQVGFNPFPPPTLPSLLGTPTATFTPAVAIDVATWTPTPTFTVAPTETVVPTDTPTPVPTATPIPQPPFALQPGNPVRIPNIANDDACDWEPVLVVDGKHAIQTALFELDLRDLTDDTVCSAVIVACEVVAAANGHPLRRFKALAKDASEWLPETQYRPTKRVVARARKVATAVQENSGLADL